MKTQLYRLRLIGVILVYLFAAIFTLVDKLPFVNQLELGINLGYWRSNGGFLVAVAFWFNLFLYSILPVLIATLAIKDRVVVICSYVLPVFWGFLLYLSISDTGAQSEVLIPDMKYFIYGFLFVSTAVMIVKLVMIARSLQVEKTIEGLEKFKKRALKKLTNMNPKHNQKLFEDLLGNHGKALNLLKAATYEEDEEERYLLMRMALNYVATEEESIEVLLKRLTTYSTIKME